MHECDKPLMQALQDYFGKHFVKLDDERLLNMVTHAVLANAKAGKNGDRPWCVINRAVDKLTQT